MHGIASVGAHSVQAAPQGAGINVLPLSSGASFQLAALTNPVNQFTPRGVSAAASSALGSQTVATLLQTQDLSQTQARGGGHGGGGHHHGSMTPSLETEEAAASEEAQILRPRKQLTKAVKAANASETAKTDENGVDTEDVEQTEEENKEGNVNS